MNRSKLISLAIFTTSMLVGAHTAVADADTRTERALVLDVELDPVAYALDGYSLHVGLRWDRVRVDLGAFALDMPELLHGTEGLEVSGSGFGIKVDVEPLASHRSLIVGAQLSRARETVTATGGGASSRATHITVGARVGYRIDIARGFYVLPWIGVDISTTDRTQIVGDLEYKPGRAIVFPTVHLGKRF